MTAALPILCATAMMVPIGSYSAVPADTEKRGVGDDMHRQPRFRRRGPGAGYEREEKEDESGTRGHDFYDLSDFTEDEKLNLIKMAYSLYRYGDGVDWDEQRDKFVRTVQSTSRHERSDAILARNGGDDMKEGEYIDHDGNDDAYDGGWDDTLDWDTVIVPTSTGGVADVDEKYVDGNHDAYDGGLDDTLDGDIIETHADNSKLLPLGHPNILSQLSRRRLQDVINNLDGDVFDGYEYSKGACPNAGKRGVPCAPPNLSALCNKYDRSDGSFRACLDACAPAFCCIHDAPRNLNPMAPNCNDDENCSQYNYCYIAWWKLHDTVGPALYLRVDQDDEFYDIEADEIQEDSSGSELFTQVLLHHFDDLEKVIEDGTVETPGEGSEFNADRIFLDENYWVYPVAGVVDVDIDG